MRPLFCISFFSSVSAVASAAATVTATDAVVAVVASVQYHFCGYKMEKCMCLRCVYRIMLLDVGMFTVCTRCLFIAFLLICSSNNRNQNHEREDNKCIKSQYNTNDGQMCVSVSFFWLQDSLSIVVGFRIMHKVIWQTKLNNRNNTITEAICITEQKKRIHKIHNNFEKF